MKINIGLEIHIKLNTKRKLFCYCLNTEKNNNSCYICLGYPGTIPTLNMEVIEKAIDFSSYFSNNIYEVLVFERKHYLYPDLPKGYQITQQFFPLIKNQIINILPKDLYIERISIEEDAAKSEKISGIRHIDFNRCGTPLIEFCTSPDFSSIEEVILFLKIIRNVSEKKNMIDALRSDCIRCDVNISLNGGKKVEIKNVNSISNIKKALSFEIKRQSNILSEGKEVIQETRTWKNNETVVQRKKENARDYFFIPEYNIPNINLTTLSKLHDNYTLKEKIIQSRDFYYVNICNWENYISYIDFLDVERINKLFHICLNINTFLLFSFLNDKKDLKKFIDLSYFLFFDIKKDTKIIEDILSNKDLLKKELKEIKNILYNKPLNEKEIMSFASSILENIKEKYEPKKSLPILIKEIKSKFNNLSLNKDLVDKLKNLLS